MAEAQEGVAMRSHAVLFPFREAVDASRPPVAIQLDWLIPREIGATLYRRRAIRAGRIWVYLDRTGKPLVL